MMHTLQTSLFLLLITAAVAQQGEVAIVDPIATSAEDTFNSLNINSPLQETYEDCGGLLPVTTTLDLLRYQVPIPAGTRCVWILDSDYTTLELYFDHFEGWAGAVPVAGVGLRLFYYSSPTATSLSSHTISPVPSSNFIFQPGDRASYLLLSADAAGTGVGDQFRLGFRGKGPVKSRSAGFVRHREGTPVTVNSHSGQYSNNERSVLAAQPGVAVGFRVQFMDLENDRDFLYVYRLAPYHELVFEVNYSYRFTGYHPFGPPGSIIPSTTELQLFVFRSDSSIRGEGFRVNWAV